MKKSLNKSKIVLMSCFILMFLFSVFGIKNALADTPAFELQGV